MENDRNLLMKFLICWVTKREILHKNKEFYLLNRNKLSTINRFPTCTDKPFDIFIIPDQHNSNYNKQT